MARTEVTAQTATRDGLSPSMTAATSDGHMFVNNGRRYVRITNTSASPVTVTIPVGATVDGQTVSGRQISVPDTDGDVSTGFWPVAYNQPDGMVHVDYSATSGVSVAVVECPPV
ncbi:hypothetical protein GCM10009799_20570 [Nocardiopsis rhodophaea]|uniref:Uncharacterized protein n=1 Tax=Nocardiopsis rhodophaea TaxID=280238 RepID=A0ABP5EA75_9ACTN